MLVRGWTANLICKDKRAALKTGAHLAGHPWALGGTASREGRRSLVQRDTVRAPLGQSSCWELRPQGDQLPENLDLRLCPLASGQTLSAGDQGGFLGTTDHILSQMLLLHPPNHKPPPLAWSQPDPSYAVPCPSHSQSCLDPRPRPPAPPLLGTSQVPPQDPKAIGLHALENALVIDEGVHE